MPDRVRGVSVSQQIRPGIVPQLTLSLFDRSLQVTLTVRRTAPSIMVSALHLCFRRPAGRWSMRPGVPSSAQTETSGEEVMRILVTGHLGYIGTVLTPMVLRAGHTVVGYDSNLFARCTYSAGGEICDVPHIRKDVRDADVADFEGIDAVLFIWPRSPMTRSAI